MTTRALILAAGQGTRLRPLTDDRPKCLVELGGRALLTRQLGALSACGVEEVTVLTGYREDLIRAAHPDVEVRHNTAYATTNMVVTLFCAADRMGADANLLVVYGDVLFEPRVVRALLVGSGEVSLAVNARWRELWEARMDDPLADAETLEMDATGRVTDIGRKVSDYAQVQGQYMGLIHFRADIAARLPTIYAAMDRGASYDGGSFENMYMTAFLRHLIASGLEVRGVVVEGGWLEVDSVSDLDLYERLHEQGELDAFCALGDDVS